jgi:hypothetical protein
MYSQPSRLQTGGLYLKNVSKKGFKPILDMILHPHSTLKNLTYDSLKGFMVVLTVDTPQSEYNYLSETSPRTFTKPVTEFLLKLALITETEKNMGRIENVSQKTPVSRGGRKEEEEEEGILKYSETKKSFIEEAKIQQKIWYTSLSNGKEQLCPSIANFSLFTNKNSKRLISILKNKTKDEVLKRIIFKWIHDTLYSDSTTELGIITMPLIQKSATFDSYLKSYENGNLPRRDFLMAIESFLIQILRLWIDHRIYHADLHTNNSLIYKDDDGEIKCVLIDFGRIVDFKEFTRKYQDEDGLTRDFFVSLNERMDRKIRELGFTLLSKYKNNGLETPPNLSTNQKIDGIEKLYDDVYNFDNMYYNKVYELEHGNSYDYYKTISSLHFSEKNGLFERVYNRLRKMYSTTVTKNGANQNIDFFLKNKKRFMFIDSTASDYGYYYYSLKGYNNVRNARDDVEAEKETNFNFNKGKRKLGRKTVGKRNQRRNGIGFGKDLIRRFFLTRKI